MFKIGMLKSPKLNLTVASPVITAPSRRALTSHVTSFFTPCRSSVPVSCNVCSCPAAMLLSKPLTFVAVNVAIGYLPVSSARFCTRESRIDLSLFNVFRFTVNTVGFDASRSNPSAVSVNDPLMSFVVPLAVDGSGRLASFSSAKNAASLRSGTIVNVRAPPAVADPAPGAVVCRSCGIVGAVVASLLSSRMKNHHPPAAAATTTSAATPSIANRFILACSPRCLRGRCSGSRSCMRRNRYEESNRRRGLGLFQSGCARTARVS